MSKAELSENIYAIFEGKKILAFFVFKSNTTLGGHLYSTAQSIRERLPFEPSAKYNVFADILRINFVRHQKPFPLR
jgi:hypothetical protein